MLGLVSVYLQPVFYPSDDERLNEGMSMWASLTVRRHNERKEGVGSVERVPMLVFLTHLTAAARCFTVWRAVFS